VFLLVELVEGTVGDLSKREHWLFLQPIMLKTKASRVFVNASLTRVFPRFFVPDSDWPSVFE